MKRILFAFALLATTLLPAARAQEGNVLKAHVPFAFTAGNDSFPAGTYIVYAHLHGTITLANENRTLEHTMAIMPSPQSPHKDALIFERIGDHFMLRHVLCPTRSDMTVDIPKWKSGKKPREAKNEHGEEVVLVASLTR